MISESLARYLWPSADAVGRRLITIGAEAESDGAPAWQTVVGVVEDARYRELERGRFDLYVPFTQVSMGLNHLVIRTEGDPARLAAALRSEVRRADPNFAIESITPLRGLVDDVMRPWRFNMTMASLLAGLAAGLAAFGLFGAVAYGVSRRTKEISVRRALGAQGRRRAAARLGTRVRAHPARGPRSVSGLRFLPASCCARFSSVWRRGKRGRSPRSPRCSSPCARRRVCWPPGGRRGSIRSRRSERPSDRGKKHLRMPLRPGRPEPSTSPARSSEARHGAEPERARERCGADRKS